MNCLEGLSGMRSCGSMFEWIRLDDDYDDDGVGFDEYSIAQHSDGV